MSKRILNDVVAKEFFREPAPVLKQPINTKKSKTKAYLFVFIFLAATASFLIFFERKTTVRVSPKRFAIEINKSLQPVFKTIEISDSHSDIFEATKRISRDQFANGTVSIFNKSKDAQVLIASTRLEAPNGNIYRIPKTIVVPGAKSQGGKSVPGSLNVAVAADKPGAQYNAGLLDFTLPGLKGSSKYELVFGRSKTEMTGGSSGEQRIVGRGDVDGALTKLLAEARSGALTVIIKKLPEGEFFIPASLEYIITNESAVPSAGENADKFEFRINGVARGIIINKKVLIKALIGDNPLIQDPFLAGLADIKNLDKLSIKIFGYKFGGSALTIAVSGQAEVELTLDTEDIKEVIVSQNIENAATLLEMFPQIARAEITQKPFWLRPFLRRIPNNPSRIDIIIE